MPAPPTSLGVRQATLKSFVRRLLGPEFALIREDQSWALKERIGENLIHFALSGEVAGTKVLAHGDGETVVKVDGVQVGGFSTELGECEVSVVDGSIAADPSSTHFALVILLPLMQKLYDHEASLAEEIIDL